MKSFQLFRHPVFTLLFAAIPTFILGQNVGIGTNTPTEKLHIANGHLLITPNTSGIGLTHFSPLVKLRARKPVSGDEAGVSFGLEFEVNSDPVGSIKAINPPNIALIRPQIRISRSTSTAGDLTVTDEVITSTASFSNTGIGMYRAGEAVELKPGFRATEGSMVNMQIKSCNEQN